VSPRPRTSSRKTGGATSSRKTGGATRSASRSRSSAKTSATSTTNAGAQELVPQFGGVAEPVTEAQPTVSKQGGFVNAMPLLTTGASGPIVAYLAKLLDEHGFANHVHAGTAPAMLDDALMTLVRAFQDAQGIDPSKPQDGAAPLIPKSHEGLVDARTWEKLIGDSDELAVDARFPAAALAQEINR
jgi:hypothetical protein